MRKMKNIQSTKLRHRNEASFFSSFFIVWFYSHTLYSPSIPSDPYLPWFNCAQQLAMSVPPGLGKTHFIVGYSPETAKPTPERKPESTTCQSGDCKAYFTPNNVGALSINCIN